MKKILVFGATSAIAEATTRLFASDGDKLYLVARNVSRLERIRDDLRIRGAVKVETSVMDANSIEQHATVIERAIAALGGLDIALIAHGTLPDQKTCEHSVEHMLRELQTNCTSTLSLVTHLANWFEQQGQGTIAVISSVAGASPYGELGDTLPKIDNFGTDPSLGCPVDIELERGISAPHAVGQAEHESPDMGVARAIGWSPSFEEL